MKSNSYWKELVQMFLKWFLVTSISFSVLHILTNFAFELGEPLGFLILFFPIPIGYGILGFLQSRIMRLRRETFFWVLQAMLMMGIYYYLGDYLQNLRQLQKILSLLNLIPGFVAGGLLGCAQFYILRKRTSEAIWWIPASILSWGLSFIFGWNLLSLIGEKISYVLPNLIFIGIINAILTGFAYCFSFSNQNSHAESQG